MEHVEPSGNVISTALVNTNPIVGFILNNKKLIAVLVVCLAVAGLIGYQFVNIKIKNARISLLKSQITALTNEINVYKDEIGKCKSEYTKLSDSIADISKTSKDIQNKMNSIVPTLTQIKTDTNLVIEDIKNTPDPQTCEEAMDFLSRWYK